MPISDMGRTAAFSSALLSVLFTVLTFVSTPPEWADIETYRRGFHSSQMLSFVPVFFLAPAFVTVVVAIHYSIAGERRIFTTLAIVFAAAYMVLIDTNYYTQLTVVRHNLLAGELSGLALFAVPNFHSLFTAVEAIGYFFMGLASFALAPLFSATRVDRRIRGLLVLNGVLAVLGIVGNAADAMPVVFAGLALWCFAFPAMMIVLGRWFERKR